MKKVKKMILCIPIQLVIVALTIHNAQGDTQLQKSSITDKSYLNKLDKGHVKRILAIGDSLTEGYFADGRKFHPYTTSLERRLNTAFNFTRFEVINEGITGDCALDTITRKLPEVLIRETNLLDLVIILIGVGSLNKLNCSKRHDAAQDIIKMHKLVHKAGLTSVVMTIPECLELDQKHNKERVLTNKKIRKFAKKNKQNTWFYDLSKKLPMTSLFDFDRKVYWDDSVHPSEVGYDKIGFLLFNLIKKKLKGSTTISSESKSLKPHTMIL